MEQQPKRKRAHGLSSRVNEKLLTRELNLELPVDLNNPYVSVLQVFEFSRPPPPVSPTTTYTYGTISSALGTSPCTLSTPSGDFGNVPGANESKWIVVLEFLRPLNVPPRRTPLTSQKNAG